LTLGELSKETGVNYHTLYKRYQGGERGDGLVASHYARIFIEHYGKKTTIGELAKTTGIPYQTLSRRYHAGERDGALVSTEKKKNRRLYEFQGKMLPMDTIVSLLGRSESIVRSSYYRYGNFDYVNEKHPRKLRKARVLCTIGGVKYMARDVSRILGISRQAISQHYLSKGKKGFTEWLKNRLEKD
jgi:DNA-binding transcriptional regulator YhcF (GntR family)